jgi:hypothetical protein
MRHFDFVVDAPPAPGHRPRLIEVEDEHGRSITIGTWLQRPDGQWVLRITRQDAVDALRD